MSDRQLTLSRLLAAQASQNPEAVALLTPERSPATYARLLDRTLRASAALNAAGIGRGDRVAVVLPNGPQMASAFLAIAATAECAPLNPAYRESEFEFYLGDLRPKALLLEAGSDSPAAAAAKAFGIPVIRLEPGTTGESGDFRLSHALPAQPAANCCPAEPDDVALLLHTSGTTSRPKLVPLTHRNLCHSAYNIADALALTPADRCLNVMPLFHIHGLEAAVLSSLAAGGSVVCSPGFLAPKFFAWLDEFRPTWYTAVPTMHQAILARAAENAAVLRRAPLRVIRSCSAPLPPPVMAELERTFGTPVIESYGMTEAAHQMASNPLPPGIRKPGSVGKAAGPEIAIMDDAGALLPRGETGEIVIRGPNVMRGYEGNPVANEAAFVNGWFRTGDRGLLDEDGYLCVRGRTKEIINRGGEKISPREIDDVLLEHPAVAQALAFAMPDYRLGEDVAAAVVLRPGAAASEAELRRFAAIRLADFKVPRVVVFLEEIPKGPTGKPQRIGLAAKLGITAINARAQEGQEYVAPRTAAETSLAAIWRDVLGRERIGVRDDFFDLGGDSILAAQVACRASECMTGAVTAAMVFDYRTIEALAVADERVAGEKAPAIQRRPDRVESPLSSAQQRLWFLEQYEPGNPAYLRSSAWRLKGELDTAALRAALNRIVAKHESLRTRFFSRGGAPCQAVRPPQPVELQILDVGDETAAHEVLRSHALRPFDLSKDQLLRAVLVRVTAQEHVLLATMHHIVFDGWSAQVFERELADFYSGNPGRDLPLPIQFADYAVRQRERLESGGFDREIAYWTKRLAGAQPLLPLPTDRSRPARQTYNGATERFELGPELTQALARLARDEHVTLFMTLLAGFKVLLYRYTAIEDIAVGCPVANRNRVELEPLIGMFVNTLVMRTDLTGRPSFRDLLARVRDTVLGAMAHEDAPLERVIEALQPERSLSYSPLFQVMFQLRNLPLAAVEFSGLEVQAFEFDQGTAAFDLSLELTPRDGALSAAVNYNTDLFDRDTSRAMFEHYRTLLEAAAAEPEKSIAELPVMTAPERSRVLAEWNRTDRNYPGGTLASLFEAQAAQRPHAVAIICGAGRLTYSDIDSRANQIARVLLRRGVKAESIVGIAVERSERAIIAMLGILKAGGAFLALDPAYPRERLRFLIEDAQPEIVLADAVGLGALPPGGPAVLRLDGEWEASAAQETEGQGTHESVAYVIYTSGSTGQPKGILGTHRGVLNRLHWMWEAYPFKPGEVCCQKTALTFVDSIAEIFGPLLAGVPLALIPDEVVKGSSLDFIRMLDRERVTRIVLVPSVLAAIVESFERGSVAPPARLKYWVSSGEALSPELAGRFFRAVPHGVLINLYGSSEVAADVTCYEAPRTGVRDCVPIGRPIANTQIYVLDPNMQPVPPGVPGEICVGGAGLARGYLNRPELTGEKFVANPFGPPGCKLFRTGDSGRWSAGGDLIFLGRVESGQVKIRGIRIDTREVEAALMRHPQVKAAVVIAHGEGLAAYVVPRNGAVPANGTLGEHLRSIVPWYMVPGRFVSLNELPLLPSGKVDHAALPRPDQFAAGPAARPPRDDHERRLQKIWEDLLGTGQLGIDDNFFEHGGHSLLTARMAARIEEAFGVRLPVSALFETPTIAGLAATIRGEIEPVYPRRIVRLQPHGALPPFVCLGAGASFFQLARQFAPDQPFCGIVLDDSDLAEFAPPYRVEAIVESIVRSLREVQPQGPYYLGGHSLQGLYAFEAAQQLRRAGEEVPLLAIFDTFLPFMVRERYRLGLRSREYARAIAQNLFSGSFGQALTHVKTVIDRAARLPTRIRNTISGVRHRSGAPAATIREAMRLAASTYDPQPYAGRLVFFEAEKQPVGPDAGASLGWRELATGELEIRVVPGDHLTLLDEPHAGHLATELTACLRQMQAAPSNTHACR